MAHKKCKYDTHTPKCDECLCLIRARDRALEIVNELGNYSRLNVTDVRANELKLVAATLHFRLVELCRDRKLNCEESKT